MTTRFLLLLFLPCFSVQSQNLIANGGFEDINVCSEFNALCAPEAWFRLPPGKPSATRNLPHPVEGNQFGMVVMESFIEPFVGRIFLYSGLLCPLEAGLSYRLSFYVNPSRQDKYQLGVHLSAEKPNLKQTFLKGSNNTILSITEKDSRPYQKDGWQEVSLTFTAKGGEQYITFGNFDPNPMDTQKKNKNRLDLKYLIDRVELVPMSRPAPCSDLEARRTLLYNQDSRHTNELGELIPEKKDSIPAAQPVAEAEDEEYDDDEPVQEPEELTFVIPDIGFAFGKFDLNASADPILERCAAQIKELQPSAIHISGYTDDVGSEAFNLDLSEKRAMAVRKWFMEKHALPEATFTVKGLGESEPLQSNDTEAGRQANRRVVIRFIR